MLGATLALPARSAREFIDQARAKPAFFSYGSSGVGASSHLVMELFKLSAGVDIVHVAYKGSQQALTDMISGQIHLFADAIGSIVPHVKAGKVRALGVTSIKRSSALPDVPTVAEAALPGFDFVNWGGIGAPTGTRADIVNRQIGRAHV